MTENFQPYQVHSNNPHSRTLLPFFRGTLTQMQQQLIGDLRLPLDCYYGWEPYGTNGYLLRDENLTTHAYVELL